MRVRSMLTKIHRYVALALSPIFLILLISGLVLSFKPILAPQLGGHSEPAQLLVVKNLIEAQKSDVSAVQFSQDASRVYLTDPKGQMTVFDAHTGAALGEAGMGAETYAWFKALHKNLLLDWGDLVEWATYLIVAVMVVGFALLLKPKLSKKLLDVHNAMAWLLLPLIVLLPVTAVLMTFKIGAPSFPAIFEGVQVYPSAEVISQLEAHPELGQLQSIERIKGRYQLITLKQAQHSQSYFIDEAQQWVAVAQPMYWPKMLHEGTWSDSPLGGWVNVLMSVVLMVLMLTGVYSWGRRFYQTHRRHALQDTDVLVAYASQTGTAEKLAQLTAQYLNPHISSSVLPMSALNVADLSQYQAVLLIVSTTGEGDLPQQAKAFVAQLATAQLQSVKYALLALGDSHYPHFCEAGVRVQAALDGAQAQALLDMHKADGNAQTYWQAWLQQVAALFHIQLSVTATIATDEEVALQLHRRTLLSTASAGVKPVWQLDFKPTAAAEFRPGDLLVYTPPQADKPRHYSIGSSCLTGEYLRLTVGLESNPSTDHGFGVSSHVLCTELAIGDSISAKIRRHDAFHPLQQPQQKMILLATGTGIASYPGFVEERRIQQSQGQTWLIFGNRSPELDFYYQALWQAGLDDGTLFRVDTAFSDTDGKYIQHTMLEQAELLYHWVVQEQAHIYICGRQQTAGDGTKAAFLQIYQSIGQTDAASAEQWWEDCLGKGRIHMDIFG